MDGGNTATEEPFYRHNPDITNRLRRGDSLASIRASLLADGLPAGVVDELLARITKTSSRHLSSTSLVFIVFLSVMGGGIGFVVGIWAAAVRISGSSAGGLWVVLEAGPLVTVPLGLLLGGMIGWSLARPSQL
jgi:hypothetical protein